MAYRTGFIQGASVLLCMCVATAATPASAEPKIVSPTNGAIVTPQFNVTATYDSVTECDTSGCSEIPAESVSLVGVDGPQTTCDTNVECPDGMAKFTAIANPGEYEISVFVSAGFSGEASEKITVIVQEPEDESEDGESSDASESGETMDDEGCGCRASPGSAQALGFASILLLLTTRRRRTTA